MHIQIVNFKLRNMTPGEYAQACKGKFAPAFRGMPGLVSKVWLSSPDTNTFGGIYTWRDKAAMESYKRSAIFKAIQSDERFSDVTSVDFAVLEAPTLMTRGVTAVFAQA